MPVYNFLPILEASRPQNDANQQIADSLFELETDSVLQSGSGWDGLAKTADQSLTLTQTAQKVLWDASMSNRFGSVLADPDVNDSMDFGPGVFAQTVAGGIRISNPTGGVRSILLTLVDLVNSNVRAQQTIVVEKQVEEVFFSGTFLAQIDSINAWAFFIAADVGVADFDVTLEGWTWYAWHISPLGYVPNNAIAGPLSVSVAGTQSQITLGHFGGMARDIASGVGPLQSVTTPEPIEGFDTLKVARSINSTLATATIVIDSDGIWDLRFSLHGIVRENKEYLFVVFLNGVRTECAARLAMATVPAALAHEHSIAASSLFNLVIGDELQLQVESANGPSDFQLEFGSFTAMKAGEAP